MGSLFGELTTHSAPEHETNHPSPTRGDRAPGAGSPDRPFPTRRELRAQREAEARGEIASGGGIASRGSSHPAAAAAERVAPAVPTPAVPAADEFDALLFGDAAPAELVAPSAVEAAAVIAAAPATTEIVVPSAEPGAVVTEPAEAEPVVRSVAVETRPVTVPAVSFAAPVAPRRAVTPEELIREDAKTVERRRRIRADRAAGRPSADPATARSIRQRITATGTMVIVGGIFASLTLPAYAFQNGTEVSAAAKQSASQTLSVADGQVTATSRDAFSVTSAADLTTQYSNALREKNLQAYLSSGARQLGDDYPWAAELTRGEGGGLSPLRYYYRECVDFVAWRLNRDAGSTTAPYKWDWSTLTPGNGNASGWKAAWQDHGWATGTTPQVGAVAWFAGQNHVSYVSGVLGDGSVVLEEYNWNNNHIYDQRIVKSSDVSLFLYAPPK